MRYAVRPLIALTFAAAFLAFPAATQAGACFSDTCDEVLTFLRSHEVIGGYADGSYRPSNSINRAEFLKIALGPYYTRQAFDRCDPEHIYAFPDASRTAWYSPYLCVAVQHEVISGYPDGTFRPSDPINFAEAAKIVSILNHAKYPDEAPFEPMESVWFDPYVRYLSVHEAIPVSFTGPYEYVSRVQMAKIMFPFYKDIVKDTGVPLLNQPSLTYGEIMGQVPRRGPSRQDGWLVHEDPMGFSFNYPPDWTVETDVPASFGTPSERGTLFRAPVPFRSVVREAWVHVHSPASCPSPSSYDSSVHLGRRPFASAPFEDAAMGGFRVEGRTYLPQDEETCFVITAAYQYHDPQFGDGSGPDAEGVKNLPSDTMKARELFNKMIVGISFY